jgi:hypothetical protein
VAKQANVELTSWNRLFTRSLAILPELLGQSHEFTLEGRDIAISLPTAESCQTTIRPADTLGARDLASALGSVHKMGSCNP